MRARLAAVVLLAFLASAGLWPLPDPGAPDAAPWLPWGARGHPLGTDALGRDRLARLAGGAPIAVALALGTGFTTAALGLLTAAARALLPRPVRTTFDLLRDALLVLPPILLVLAVGAAVRPQGPEAAGWMAVLLVGAAWPGASAILSADLDGHLAHPRMLAARTAGIRPAHALWDHVLPRLVGRAGALAVHAGQSALLAEATLGYLGLGLGPPHITWGALLAEARASVALADLAGPTLGIASVGTALAWLAPAPARDGQAAPRPGGYGPDPEEVDGELARPHAFHPHRAPRRAPPGDGRRKPGGPPD